MSFKPEGKGVFGAKNIHKTISVRGKCEGATPDAMPDLAIPLEAVEISSLKGHEGELITVFMLSRRREML